MGWWTFAVEPQLRSERAPGELSQGHSLSNSPESGFQIQVAFGFPGSVNLKHSSCGIHLRCVVYTPLTITTARVEMKERGKQIRGSWSGFPGPGFLVPRRSGAVRVRLGSVSLLRAWPHLKPAPVSRALDHRGFFPGLLVRTFSSRFGGPGFLVQLSWSRLSGSDLLVWVSWSRSLGPGLLI